MPHPGAPVSALPHPNKPSPPTSCSQIILPISCSRRCTEGASWPPPSPVSPSPSLSSSSSPSVLLDCYSCLMPLLLHLPHPLSSVSASAFCCPPAAARVYPSCPIPGLNLNLDQTTFPPTFVSPFFPSPSRPAASCIAHSSTKISRPGSSLTRE